MYDDPAKSPPPSVVQYKQADVPGGEEVNPCLESPFPPPPCPTGSNKVPAPMFKTSPKLRHTHQHNETYYMLLSAPH